MLLSSYIIYRSKFKLERSWLEVSSQQLTKTAITDISNANVEIILGLRRLGGQILKSDPGSLSEMIERTAIKNAEEKMKKRVIWPKGLNMNRLCSRKPSLPVAIQIDGAGITREFSG